MYISPDELGSNLYPEIQTAINRGETTVAETHINTALQLITSKLASRYAIATELTRTGTARNSLLVNIAKDVAIYYLYSTQETIPNIRVKRYDDAIALLDKLAEGTNILVGVEAAEPPETGQPNVQGDVSHGSKPKRGDYY